MQDLDQSGFGFQRVRTFLGPSLGWVDSLVSPSTDITTGGTHQVLPGESLLLVDVAAPVTILLPDVRQWIQQTAYQPATAFDRSITVKDLNGNAAAFNIVVTPFGLQAIDSIQQSFVITTARANVKFVPLIDLTGWAVEASSAGGGGGGGGDVFKAGNNTFTGTNAFQSTITVPTRVAGDNTQNAASTAWVQVQGYITGVALAPYALIASPTFTGDPKAPTPSPGDNDTSIATTAFVQAALSAIGTPAPANAEYITSSANATLTNERVLTNTPSITWDFTTPGQARANTSAGGGNVSSVGTPVNGQFARWTTASTIEGVDLTGLFAPINSPAFTGNPTAPTPTAGDNDTSIATTAFVTAADTAVKTQLIGTASAGMDTFGEVENFINANVMPALGNKADLNSPTFTGDPKAPTPITTDNDTSIATTAYVKANLANFQPLDGDLTALSALAGTNTIYYRSGTDTWSPVTFSGLSFSGGLLSTTGGGGNVNTSGTPNVNELAQWTDSTHVQGLPINTLHTNATLYSTTQFRNTPATPANGINIVGAAAAASPTIGAAGTDTDIGLLFSSKGASPITFYTGSFGQIGFQVSAVVGANTFITFSGQNGQSVLVNNPAGNPIAVNSLMALSAGSTVPTPAVTDNTTKIATTAYTVAYVTGQPHLFTAVQTASPVAITTGVAPDFGAAQAFTIALAGAFSVVNPSVNPTTGTYLSVTVSMTAAGALTWGTNFKGLAAYTQSTWVSGIMRDHLVFRWSGTTYDLVGVAKGINQ